MMVCICYNNYKSIYERVGYMMKKAVYLIVLLSILLLMGCDGSNLTNVTTNPTTKITSTQENTTIKTTEISNVTTSVQEQTTTLTTEEPTDDNDLIFKETLSLENKSSVYDFAASEIGVYTLKTKPGILYVDVESFITVLDEGLMNIDLSYHMGRLSLSCFPKDSHLMTVILDSDNDLIEYSDFNFFMNINKEFDLVFNYGFDVENTNYIQGDISGVIDLKPYDMTIEEDGGQIYLPLHLANLLFTGTLFEVYYIEDTLYIVDNLFSFEEAFSSQTLEDEAYEENVVKHTVNYMALLFDNFYGLKDYYGVESYIDEFRDYGFYDLTTFEEFNKFMQRYLYASGDLHTHIALFGYDGEQTEYIIPFTGDKIYKYQQTYQMESCEYREEISLKMYDDYYKLSVNAFTMETEGLLAEILVDIDPEKDLYIDLACNGGGYLYSIFDLMAYLSNDPIELNYMNQHTGEIYTNLFTPKEDLKLDNNIYVYINKTTYSAASLFAELVKENNLAYVFGYDTFGGAAIVTETVLPNNMWLYFSSSNVVFINQDLEIIEAGVSPHYTLDKYDFFDKGQEIVSSIFESKKQIDIHSMSLSNYIDLSVEAKSDDESIVFEKYIVEYRDYETGELLYSKSFFTDSFSLAEPTGIDSDLAILRVKAYFSYQGYDLIQTIHKQILDPYSDIYNMSTGQVALNTILSLNKYGLDDIDYIKIVIEELGLYRISVNDESLDLYHDFYGVDGESIGSASELVLEAGTYIVRLDTLAVNEGDYTVYIEQLYD